MKDRIDPLIHERAPWLAAQGPVVRSAKHLLDHMLGYQTVVDLAESFAHKPAADIMTEMGARLAKHVKSNGLGHIPRNGPALIVANHPTGIADGIILHHLIAQRRPDLFFFANKDILRVLPQLDVITCPVEWKTDKRSRATARETMQFMRRATEEGRLGVIFPSGRLAKRTGLRLHERPWMASAAMLARKFDLPVIPVNIRARNSVLFYMCDILHPTLRDITLFHETLNKDRQPFEVTIGPYIQGRDLPTAAEDSIQVLRQATLSLGDSNREEIDLRSVSRPLLPRLS